MTKTLAPIGRARAFLRYFRDPSASLFGKLFVFATLLYVISPVDFIPDAIPIVGWLDDVGVMGLAVAWMWRVVARYREASVIQVTQVTQVTPVSRNSTAVSTQLV